ncbi:MULTISPECIES: hypothetical protein [unclassified Thioalkalivibrio]|uniref:hypothetical protein n=1 Tax=unclassified Thioalkalivibrio TaxID=2621013 RepID=UPI000366304A|nr:MULTISPECIES: hypothetical protein [unclassified Thioalkalivibrio]
MSWNPEIPLEDHLPAEGIPLMICTPIQRAAEAEDRARDRLADTAATWSEVEIRRWLEEQHPVMRADMAQRIRTRIPAGRPGQQPADFLRRLPGSNLRPFSGWRPQKSPGWLAGQVPGLINYTDIRISDGSNSNNQA